MGKELPFSCFARARCPVRPRSRAENSLLLEERRGPPRQGEPGLPPERHPHGSVMEFPGPGPKRSRYSMPHATDPDWRLWKDIDFLFVN